MFNLKDLKKMDKNDVLNLIGLETRPSAASWVLPAIGFFSAGLVIGAGVALVLAPKSGSEIREDLRQKLQGAADQVPAFQAKTGSGEKASRTL